MQKNPSPLYGYSKAPITHKKTFVIYRQKVKVYLDLNKPCPALGGAYGQFGDTEKKCVFIENEKPLKKILKKMFLQGEESREKENALMKDFFIFLLAALCYKSKYRYLSPIQTFHLGALKITLLADEDVFVFQVISKKGGYGEKIKNERNNTSGFILSLSEEKAL